MSDLIQSIGVQILNVWMLLIENNWLVHPPNLMAKVINKFVLDRAKATLNIPEWKSSPFWPMLHDGKDFKSFVKCWKYLHEKKIITYVKGQKIRIC